MRCMHIGISTKLLRFWPLRLAVAISFLSAIHQACTQPTPPVFLKGPYLQAPGPQTMTVMWESWTNSPGLLRFGLNGELDQEARLESPWSFNGVVKVSATNISAIAKTNV